MSDPTRFRIERIEKLLYELRYEVERGIMEQDIGECIGFQFIVPKSNKTADSVVFCEFRTRPMRHYAVLPSDVAAPHGLEP